MIKAAKYTLGLILILSTASAVFAQAPLENTASAEAVRRQAARIALREKLAAADSAYSRRDLANAGKLYDEAWDLVQQTGQPSTPEAEATRVGVARVRMELAHAAQHRGDLPEADRQVRDVLRVDPTNPVAIDFKRNNDKLLAENAGRFPSADAQSQIPKILDEKAKVGTLVQDGKLLFQMGKLDEAEAKLNEARKIDPQNQAAYYYLNAIKDLRFSDALSQRDIVSRDKLIEVEKAWAEPPRRELLPTPNLYARTNLINTSKGRQVIMNKLDRIHLDSMKYEGLPLSEVINLLNDEARKRDPEKRGLNFIINNNVDAVPLAAAPGAINPVTGLPEPAAAPPEPVDIGTLQIKIMPPLNDVRLADALDAIVKVAGPTRIKYSIEDYAVVFSARTPEATPLYVRIIKVDPNTFQQGLESVVGIPFANITVTAGTGGGAGGGGGGGQGGQQGQNQAIMTVPRVTLAPIGGTQQGGGGGGQGGQGGGAGINNVTRTNLMESVHAAVRQFFSSMGVDLTPPKSIFFNDREGTLVVRATATDLDIIETAVQVLNIAPPQVNITTKFVEVGQADRKALGFDWYLGNFLVGNSALGSGGTQPTLNGAPSTANPEGSFPGSFLGNTFLAPLPTDGKLTQGVRNQVGFRNALDTPSLATFTGILTDPQFRVVLRALEQRDGVDLLNQSSVTTLSGRQTQIQIVDLQSIVTGVVLQQTGAGGGGGGGGGINNQGGVGVVAPQVNYDVQVLPFGPTLDVIPYVSADGFTIQMTIIPTITEFLGYDDPGAFVPSAAAISGGAGVNLANQTLTATLPLPKFRLRQITTSAIVWDGQTVVLGGLITEDVTKIKDKVPILGDLPFVGRLFRSESTSTSKRNLMVFVTPTIIDPAGNRYHSEDEMPFNPNTIPPQKPLASASQ